MAATIRNVGTATFGTAGTITPTNPTHANGDILLCFVGSSANGSVTPTHSLGGSWAQVDTGEITSGTVRAKCTCYWLRASSGAESNPTITVTPTGNTAAHHSAVVISVQSAIGTGTPYEGASHNQAAATNALALTLTTSTADTLGFEAVHHADNVATGTTDSNTYTARVDTDDATGIDGFLSVKSKALAGAGGSGKGSTITFTSGGTGVGIAGVAFAIIPGTGIIPTVMHFARIRRS